MWGPVAGPSELWVLWVLPARLVDGRLAVVTGVGGLALFLPVVLAANWLAATLDRTLQRVAGGE